jgi:hypothetical protein
LVSEDDKRKAAADLKAGGQRAEAKIRENFGDAALDEIRSLGAKSAEPAKAAPGVADGYFSLKSPEDRRKFKAEEDAKKSAESSKEKDAVTAAAKAAIDSGSVDGARKAQAMSGFLSLDAALKIKINELSERRR